MAKKIFHKGSGRRVINVPGGNCMANAFAATEAKYTMAVQRDTWGHLAPKKAKKYTGFILMTFTAWGHTQAIDCKFRSLKMSHELFDDMNEFIQSQHLASREGQVWRFEGTYTKSNDGTCQFSGNMTQIKTN